MYESPDKEHFGNRGLRAGGMNLVGMSEPIEMQESIERIHEEMKNEADGGTGGRL